MNESTYESQYRMILFCPRARARSLLRGCKADRVRFFFSYRRILSIIRNQRDRVFCSAIHKRASCSPARKHSQSLSELGLNGEKESLVTFLSSLRICSALGREDDRDKIMIYIQKMVLSFIREDRLFNQLSQINKIRG